MQRESHRAANVSWRFISCGSASMPDGALACSTSLRAYGERSPCRFTRFRIQRRAAPVWMAQFHLLPEPGWYRLSRWHCPLPVRALQAVVYLLRWCSRGLGRLISSTSATGASAFCQVCSRAESLSAGLSRAGIDKRYWKVFMEECRFLKKSEKKSMFCALHECNPEQLFFFLYPGAERGKSAWSGGHQSSVCSTRASSS